MRFPALPHAAPWCATAAALPLIALGLVLSGQALNTAWFLDINGGNRATLQHLAAQLTLLGSGYVSILLMLACDRGHGIGPALALRVLLLGALVTRLGKMALAEPRPLLSLGPDAVHVIGAPVMSSNAMPSGHTLTAFAGALALWWIWQATLRQRSRRGVGLGLALLMALAAGVAWSRIAVGAHWPSDVLAGAGCGLLVTVLALRWERHGQWARHFAHPLAQRVLALVEIALALTWLNLALPPDGLWLQLLIGAMALASGAARLRRSLRNAPLRQPAPGQAALP